MMFGSDTFVQTDYTELGTMTVVAAGLATVALAFLGRTKLPRGVLVIALVACGAALGLGGAWIEADYLPRSVGGDMGLGPQRLTAVLLLAILTPLHVRVVLGPLGRRG
ncbi:MAG: hypothetical protein LC722_00675 [Actinobacteria bacterium]|nr:hypothetical protein [Actinomycetota bacterium]